jgi:hypothetical protein
VSENFNFQCDPFSNKKDGPAAANGACQKWHILFLDIFQRKLGTSILDGHEKIIV